MLGIASAYGVRLDLTPVVTESDPTYIALVRAVTDEAIKHTEVIQKNLAVHVVNTYGQAVEKG